MTSYSLQHAARILRVKPSRLRYWERTELIARPAIEAEQAEQVAFEFKDLVGVRSILHLVEHGVPLRRIRRSLDQLRERAPDLSDPASSLRLWVDGSARIVVRHEGVLQEPGGQLVLDLTKSDAEVGEDVRDLNAGEVDGAVGGAASEHGPSLEETVLDWFERGCELDQDPATYSDAIEAYETALGLDECFPDAHCNLGAVHYNRGQRDAARRHFARCLELAEHHVEGHFNLANLLEEDGADEMALYHYRAALVSDPGYPDLHINLALLLEKLGRERAAADHWRRYLQLAPDGSWVDVARQRTLAGDITPQT